MQKFHNFFIVLYNAHNRLTFFYYFIIGVTGRPYKEYKGKPCSIPAIPNQAVPGSPWPRHSQDGGGASAGRKENDDSKRQNQTGQNQSRKEMIEDLRTFVEQDDKTETETQVGKGDGTTEQTGVPPSEQKKMEADEGSMNIDQPSSLFNAVISEINKR